MTETPILDESAVSEIEARADRASSPPWLSPANTQPWTNDAAELNAIVCGDGGYVHHRNWKQVCLNMDFISRARTDIPALCATVRHLRAENERLALQLKDWQEEKDTKAGYL